MTNLQLTYLMMKDRFPLRLRTDRDVYLFTSSQHCFEDSIEYNKKEEKAFGLKRRKTVFIYWQSVTRKNKRNL
jgi:hypothetical protein